MAKQPERLPLEKIYDILPNDIKHNKDIIGYHNGIGVANGIDKHLFSHLGLTSSPFLLEDYRMGIVAKGALRGIVNLREYNMTEGTAVFITPGTIAEPLEVSDDFLMKGVGVPADKFMLAHGGVLPQLFCGRTHDGRKTLTMDERHILENMISLLHNIMTGPHATDSVIGSMITTISHYYDRLFSDSLTTAAPSRSGEIFNRFLQLANLYGPKEHHLTFYARKLCITSRYLGTTVLSVSGVGAKEWIDRAIVAKAKVMLRHTDKQITQIADELNFPNASFFCKYFKNSTGLTPLEYRNGILK